MKLLSGEMGVWNEGSGEGGGREAPLWGVSEVRTCRWVGVLKE